MRAAPLALWVLGCTHLRKAPNKRAVVSAKVLVKPRTSVVHCDGPLGDVCEAVIGNQDITRAPKEDTNLHFLKGVVDDLAAAQHII